MIQGVVSDRLEAIVVVTGPLGQTREIEAVVDTGFNGFLTLPPALVTELGLPLVTTGRAFLADGGVVEFDVFNVRVTWDGRPRHIEAYAAQTTSLVGMALLNGHSLFVEVVEGGRVAIQPHG